MGSAKLNISISRFVIMLIYLSLNVAAAGSDVGAEERVNLIKNPGFELGEQDPWYVYHSGELTVKRDSTEAHSGEFYVTFKWAPHVKGGYSSIMSSRCEVQPGTPYKVSVWAKGKGQLQLWINMSSTANRFMSTDFGPTYRLKDKWTYIERTWTPEAGIHGARLHLWIRPDTFASFDDATVSYNRIDYPPPKIETTEISNHVRTSDAAAHLFINGKEAANQTDVPYGEYVLAIKGKATGNHPALFGQVKVGDFVVPIDTRWRVSVLPADDGWMKPGFDDRKWGLAQGEKGIWSSDGNKDIALRRVVLWENKRRHPWQVNQWIPMMTEHMFLPEGGVHSWMSIIIPPASQPSSELTLNLEMPAFLHLIDKKEQATDHLSNYHPKDVAIEPFTRHGTNYNRYRMLYAIPKPGSNFRAWAPLHFTVDSKIPHSPRYVFRYWREANSNITDVPVTLPITLTGPVNGRQCKYFQLIYNTPGIMHSGGFGAFSLSERKAISDILIACGMNVAYLESFTERMGVLDSHRYLSDHGVRFYAWFNMGMNYPPEGKPRQFLEEHPEYAGRTYEGDPEKAKKAFPGNYGTWKWGKSVTMWSHEYLAEGGKEFYDFMRPRIEEGRKKIPGVRYLLWDWEYDTFKLSTFSERDIKAFRRFANITENVKLTDEIIVEHHADAWRSFRLDQTARHIRSMITFLKEYNITLVNYHPGPSIDFPDVHFSPLKDVLEAQLMGWGGSSPPIYGIGRDGGPSGGWRKLMPDIHLVANRQVSMYRAEVIDERILKIWAMNMCLATAGGGWTRFNISMRPYWQTGGMSYFLGEATRMIDAFGDTFRHAKHVTKRFSQSGLEGLGSGFVALEAPDADSVLVLLFNENDRPVNVTVESEAVRGWKVKQWEGPGFQRAHKVKVEVPALDVIALDYRQ